VLCVARWKCRTQNSPSGHHRTTLSGYIFATKACIDNLFPGPPGWASARRELLDFMVQGKADTPTSRLGATPSGLTSAHLHHPPIFFTGRMPFLLPNQQRQSTEGTLYTMFNFILKTKVYTHSPKDCRGQCWSLVSESDSSQVILATNPAIGCHYFLPGPRLPSQLQRVIILGRYQFLPLDEQKHVCVNDLTRVRAWQQYG